MISPVLRLASLGGVAELTLHSASANDPALWGVVITSIGAIIAQVLKMREDRKREERQHEWLRQDRIAAEKSRQMIQARIAENTAITRSLSVPKDERADAATVE